MRVLRALMRIDRKEAACLFGAPWYLLCAWFEFRLRPVKAIIVDLQRIDSGSGVIPGAVSFFEPTTAGWAIAVAARYVPWRSDCMIQAIATARWLRRHGFTPTLHLGIARSDQGAIEAHAWIALDGVVVVGGGAGILDRFTPILGVPTHEQSEAISR